MAKKQQRDNLLVRTTAFFFEKWKLTLVIWLALLSAGIYTYTSVIPREGFPPISFPISFVSGAYPGQDQVAVDQQISEPLALALAEAEQITDVDSTASDGFFSASVAFDDSVTSRTGTELVEQIIADDVTIPAGAVIQAVPVDPGSFLFEFDMVLHVYTRGVDDLATLDAAAEVVAAEVESLDIVQEARPLSNLQSTETDTFQNSFARVAFSSEDDDVVEFYPASTIGIKQIADADALELSDDVVAQLEQVDLSSFGDDVDTIISADFATDIRENISFLESNMATGLLAVAFFSFLLISWRASLITGLFMLTVMFTTILILYLIGYTLNVITLFALILSLGLFVDDATIAVEAIDVNRRNKKLKNLDAAKNAVRKVGLASLSGTLTTVLVFAILAAPTGVLGEFIRLIPVTVVVALLTSFVLSMTLIPFLSRFLILRTRTVSWITKVNPIVKFEEWLGERIERVVLMVRHRSGKLIGFGAVAISLFAVGYGFYVFGFKVDNNTFPPSKDSDLLSVQVQFTESLSVAEASEVSTRLDDIISDVSGEHIIGGSYIGERLSDAQQATILLDLVPFTDRDITAPTIAEELNEAIAEEAADLPMTVVVRSSDTGPPVSQFPFGIRVYSDDSELLAAATQAISDELVGITLENFNGDTIDVLDSQIDGLGQEFLRDNGRRYAITRLSYDSENPTLVSLLTEEEFIERFEDGVFAGVGFTLDDVEYDAGQEGDFQDSFNTLALAVPVAILLMYLLLAFQFRSLLQPILILFAIPLSMFGVANGLLATDNAASFFSLVGFIGLIGIAVNNTIMLTDYANQERRKGAGSVEAIASAARQRLRPLVTTTVTTLVALLPLALSDPFWEALAFTIIFGLISSTIFVLISFPYYYLATEWVRARVNRVQGLGLFVLFILLVFGLGLPGLGLFILSVIALIVRNKHSRA